MLTDVHLKSNYDPNGSAKVYCQTPKTDDEKDVSAPMGRISCDTPSSMVEKFIEKVAYDYKKKNRKLDLLFLTGDFIAHKVAMTLGKPDDPDKYAMMKEVLSNISNWVDKYLPDTYILPTLGNNDYLYHYQSPQVARQEDFYNHLYKIWFEDNPKKLPNIENIEKTFKSGGYYRTDLNDNLSVLGLNTLIFNKKNDESYQTPGAGKEQMDWIEKQLKESSDDRKFILTCHIYPGVLLEDEGLKDHWKDNYITEF